MVILFAVDLYFLMDFLDVFTFWLIYRQVFDGPVETQKKARPFSAKVEPYWLFPDIPLAAGADQTR